MHRNAGKNRVLLRKAVMETLGSRLMLSADVDAAAEYVDEGEVIEAEILPLEIGEGEAIPEEWYTLELPVGDGEVIADEGEFEILILEEGGEGEVKDGEVLEGEVENPDEIFYTMGEMEGEELPSEEESPVVGEGVDGEVIITMLPEGSDGEGEPLPDEELPAETVWLTSTLECSQPASVTKALAKAVVRFGDEDCDQPVQAANPKKGGSGARWAPPEGDALPDDFVPPDDTPESDEPVEGGDVDSGLAMIADDQLPDGSAFGGDVAIENDILGTEEDILA